MSYFADHPSFYKKHTQKESTYQPKPKQISNISSTGVQNKCPDIPELSCFLSTKASLQAQNIHHNLGSKKREISSVFNKLNTPYFSNKKQEIIVFGSFPTLTDSDDSDLENSQQAQVFEHASEGNILSKDSTTVVQCPTHINESTEVIATCEDYGWFIDFE